MAADPSRPRDSGPRIDALERRADRAEDYLRQVLSNEVAAVRGAVGLLPLDMQALRGEVTRNGQLLDHVSAEVAALARSEIEHGAALATLAGKVDEMEGKVDSHGEMLAEILRRLAAAGE
jgi:erythromycin esterase-like protein